MPDTRWENWSGSVSTTPTERYVPETEADLVDIVDRHAPADTIRAVGAGHSFTRLGETANVLVSMDALRGVTTVDPAAERATVRAGTRLEAMNASLADHGLAMTNIGDIDQQRLAGAMVTGTHGTGREFGILATQIAEARVVTADGDVVTVAPDDGDPFQAAQVCLGALGLFSSLTLDLVPAYDLKMVKRSVSLDVALEHMDALLASNRHAEFFWWPDQDVAEVKTIDRPNQLHEPALPGATVEEVQVGPSHEVFPTVREIRFNEMEYGLPASAGPAAMREIQSLVTSRDDVSFPVEYRFVRGDDIPLSPAFDRDTVFIAVHKYHEKPYADFFEQAEAIFRSHGGRPHWGKHHTLTASELASLYPRWDDFHDVRRQFDPDGVFRNEYLSALFGS